MSTVMTIKDKNVYFAGKVVGRVTDIEATSDGIKCVMVITNDKVKRYLQADVSDLTVSL